MDVEKLISLIRCQPALYDAQNSNYNVPTHRVQIWEHIAAEMNSTVTSCKARWCNLRDIYRKSKRVINKDGSLQHYRFAEQLTFLDKHLRLTRGRKATAAENHNQRHCNSSRKRRKSQNTSTDAQEVVLKIEAVETDDENNNNDENDDNNENNHNSASNDEFFVRLLPAPSTLENNNHNSCENNTTTNLNENTTNTTNATKSSLCVGYQQAVGSRTCRSCGKLCACNNAHHVDAFLSGIAPMLKQLPPVLLNRARRELFDVVSKYEMQALLNVNLKANVNTNVSESDDNNDNNDNNNNHDNHEK